MMKILPLTIALLKDPLNNNKSATWCLNIINALGYQILYSYVLRRSWQKRSLEFTSMRRTQISCGTQFLATMQLSRQHMGQKLQNQIFRRQHKGENQCNLKQI
ncbi:hypothetical protein VP01_2460g1 [Puccinia sorghi]|uniref:Uncharacterized protein n=1 Tax=Puccinia sorghi TaxID=27349 RepID=A0A0L6V608_9BASI|nr:hypothetical protein VP01_2460g1 [Puccinia sorghi]